VLAAGGEMDAEKAAVLAQVPKMHAENLKRLQEWIALPSIAAALGGLMAGYVFTDNICTRWRRGPGPRLSSGRLTVDALRRS
jgi:hypothetical protein